MTGQSLSRRAFIRGAAGSAAVAGAAGQASAQATQDGGTAEVAVGPNGEFVFEPDALEITPGTTVKWVWESDNHNVHVASQPEEANWEGHDTIENGGFEFEHTFETLGTYDYVCEPHESAGMTGSVEVVEEVSTPESSGGPQVPTSAKALGVATTVAMIATLGLAFFFIKYSGTRDEE